MKERLWHYAKDNKQQGPVSEGELQKMLTNGTLNSSTLVWSDHLSNWTPAKDVDVFITQKVVGPPPSLPASSGPSTAPGYASSSGQSSPRPVEASPRYQEPSPRYEASSPRYQPAAPLPRLAPDDPDFVLKPHPWHRNWARMIDALWAFVPATIVMMLTGFFVAGVIFGGNVKRDDAWIPFLIMMFFMFGTYICMEPIILGLFGTTLGKFAFNIRVRNRETGTKLNFVQAMQRTFFVWLRSGGWGMFIPIPFLYFAVVIPIYIVQFNNLNSNGITSWDREMNLRYEHHPMSPARWIAVGALLFFGFALFFGWQALVAFLVKDLTK